MFCGGPNKLLLSLLPAIAAFIVAIVVKDFTGTNGYWIWVVLGLLLVGGIISANFLLASTMGQMGAFTKGLLFLIIVVAYVVTFFFTGCLVAGNLGLIN